MTPSTFDDTLLETFIHQFYGYGNYQSDFWLIGMEEGGGNSYEAVVRRLTAWDKRGRNELEDAAAYHQAIGVTKLFHDRPVIQRTWGKLIRVLLNATGHHPTRESIRLFQRDQFGRRNSNHCLLELLPLPSPSTNHWLYVQYSQLPYLADRASYQMHCLEQRIYHLQNRLLGHSPKVVVFYSFNYLAHWQKITGLEFESVAAADFYVAQTAATLFIVMKHPAAKGPGNAYFDAVGQYIARQMPH
ncbi:MAG: hypothetical protein V9G20_25870 [Candidatus Promineifilaceae bacterium]